MTGSSTTSRPIPKDPDAFSIIDDMDTAIAVFYIGRDHGITSQADACLRAVTVRCRDYLAQYRRSDAREWAEARDSWLRLGPAPAPITAALEDAVRLIETLISDDRRSADAVHRNLRGPASVLPQFRAFLAKMSASTG